MPDIALIDASAQASGHPSQCTPTVSGSVDSTSSHNVTVTVGGTTKEVATIATANINFSSHAHDYTTEEGCHQNQSHSLDPDTGESSITINGSPVYLVGNGVTTDPTSGGSVDITSNPISPSVTKN